MRDGLRFVACMLAVGWLAACTASDLPECALEGAAVEYRLGPGDRIRLTAFRNEGLSGEFELDGEGYLALPLVGEVMAEDLSARQLEDEVGLRLRDAHLLGYLVEHRFNEPQELVEVELLMTQRRVDMTNAHAGSGHGRPRDAGTSPASRFKPPIVAVGSLTGWPAPSDACLFRRTVLGAHPPQAGSF